MTAPNRELPRTTIAVVTILFLLISSLYIVQPLLGAVIWATMIVVATWPLLIGLQQIDSRVPDQGDRGGSHEDGGPAPAPHR